MRLKQRSIAGKVKGKSIGGFLLLEAILAVTIFAVGVLGVYGTTQLFRRTLMKVPKILLTTNGTTPSS